jgi:hypothetical protein
VLNGHDVANRSSVGYIIRRCKRFSLLGNLALKRSVSTSSLPLHLSVMDGSSYWFDERIESRGLPGWTILDPSSPVGMNLN